MSSLAKMFDTYVLTPVLGKAPVLEPRLVTPQTQDVGVPAGPKFRDRAPNVPAAGDSYEGMRAALERRAAEMRDGVPMPNSGVNTTAPMGLPLPAPPPMPVNDPGTVPIPGEGPSRALPTVRPASGPVPPDRPVFAITPEMTGDPSTVPITTARPSSVVAPSAPAPNASAPMSAGQSAVSTSPTPEPAFNPAAAAGRSADTPSHQLSSLFIPQDPGLFAQMQALQNDTQVKKDTAAQQRRNASFQAVNSTLAKLFA